MGRFIVVTFIFMGWAFYQLSGGSGFDAEETRQSRIDAPEEIETAALQSAIVPDTPQPVERVSLELATVQEVMAPQRSFGSQASRVAAREVPRPDVVEDETAALEEEPVILLPSLIQDAVPSEATVTPVDFSNGNDTVAPQVNGERRTVTGSRVNVRGGPGTDFRVVNRLVRGDEVEILEDPGNGWVRMRPVTGGTVGWMADFLLSEG